jgi:lipid II:glycine glycyltransferase (peptidoglycan interpeptide bridge formation enzyme)
LDVYQQTAKRAKFNLHDNQYYYDVIDKLGDHSIVFAVYADDQIISFLWLAISADTAYELYGGMNELGQQLRSNYALKWYAIRKCKEWGIVRYDFGGLLDGGVTTFKRGWAENETNLAGTFDRPLSGLYTIWSYCLPMAKNSIRRVKAIFKR